MMISSKIENNGMFGMDVFGPQILNDSLISIFRIRETALYSILDRYWKPSGIRYVSMVACNNIIFKRA